MASFDPQRHIAAMARRSHTDILLYAVAWSIPIAIVGGALKAMTDEPAFLFVGVAPVAFIGLSILLYYVALASMAVAQISIAWFILLLPTAVAFTWLLIGVPQAVVLTGVVLVLKIVGFAGTPVWPKLINWLDRS